MYNVIVIGAGPCGSVAAKESAICKLNTLLVDRKKHIGRPVHCTGLISKRTVETLKISQNSILNEIKGAYIYSPNNKRITINAEEIKAYVVDRETFDKELLQEAKKKGVEIQLETEATNITGNTITVKRKGKEIKLKSDVFIGAYGARYSKNNSFTKLPPPKKILYGLQTIAHHSSIDRNFVELFFGSDYSDCFFGWAVPMDKKNAKIGLACSNAILAKKGIRNLLQQLKCNSYENPIAGIIPIGAVSTTVKDNILVCGDAAAQAKPTSGGGIYTGTLCAKIAAKTIAGYIESKNSLTEYEQSWRKKIGKELKAGMLAHQILTRLSDNQLNQIFGVLSKPGNITAIKKIGDIDYPSLLIKNFASTLKWGKIIRFFLASLS
ncbi:MAG: geranylgeranyl reductase family protein [Candidatus Ratteibacteria bacterium]|nr:geranylgeranyl reductase family protein [Candidatus Ratteibacteria bacterium]